MPAQSPAGLIVLMASRGMISVETLACFLDRTRFDGIPFSVIVEARKGIIEARNSLARRALAATLPFQSDEVFCLWIDDDVFWWPGSISRALTALRQNPTIDLLGPLVCGQEANAAPFSGDAAACEPIEVESLALNWMLHRRNTLSKLGPEAFGTTNDERDDVALWRAAKKAQLAMYVDPQIAVAHINSLTGKAFLPHQPQLTANILSLHSDLSEDMVHGKRYYGAAVDDALFGKGLRT
jgi:hypothetical protein